MTKFWWSYLKISDRLLCAVLMLRFYELEASAPNIYIKSGSIGVIRYKSVGRVRRVRSVGRWEELERFGNS